MLQYINTINIGGLKVKIFRRQYYYLFMYIFFITFHFLEKTFLSTIVIKNNCSFIITDLTKALWEEKMNKQLEH